jgi:hypothetical protein
MSAARAARRRATPVSDKFAHRLSIQTPNRSARRAERERQDAMARWRAREDRIAALEAQVPNWPALRSWCREAGVPYDLYAELLESYIAREAGR